MSTGINSWQKDAAVSLEFFIVSQSNLISLKGVSYDEARDWAVYRWHAIDCADSDGHVIPSKEYRYFIFIDDYFLKNSRFVL